MGLGTEDRSRLTVPSEFPSVEVMARIVAGATTAATEAEAGRLQQASCREGRQSAQARPCFTHKQFLHLPERLHQQHTMVHQASHGNYFKIQVNFSVNSFVHYARSKTLASAPGYYPSSTRNDLRVTLKLQSEKRRESLIHFHK